MAPWGQLLGYKFLPIAKDLVKLLAKSNLKLPETLSDQLAQDRHLMDSSLNELNRLYNKALNHLR